MNRKIFFKTVFFTALVTFFLCLILFYPFKKDLKEKNLSSNELKQEEAFVVPEITEEKEDSPLSKSLLPAQNGAVLTEDERNNIVIYNKCNAAVVNITTEVLAYNFFLEAIPQEGGSGSGSIIDASGIILTNTHVVEKAHKVFVNLSDGSQYEGKVVGKDLENDLAVIKINPEGKKLTTISFGTSKSLQIGQKVLAIGNPFGYDRTLTRGIISGLARPVRSSSNLIIQNMIQTDASINPGNSGGPLLNSAGEMVGINTMIYSPSGGSVGIGFAVPIDTARRVVPELVQYGQVKRGWLDFSPVQLNGAIVRYAGLKRTKGLLVSRVAENGYCEKAGIRGGSEAVRYGRSVIYLGGDIIIEVDGTAVDNVADLFSALEDNKPGETVNVKVDRDGKLLKIAVTLTHRPTNLLSE